jgi:peptide/nickel transport system permease protein
VRHSWLWVIGRRVVALAATVVIVPTLFFTITTALDPGPPGGPPRPPLFTQIGHFLVQTFLHFDLGRDQYGSPEVLYLTDGLPTDLALFLSGMGLGLLLGAVGGSICARHPRTKRARVLMGLSAISLSTPPYLFGFAILILFAPTTGSLLQLPFVSELSDYRLLSAGPLEWIRALWVPCLVIALPIAGQILRMTEAALRETFGEEFLRTAEAKGISGRRVLTRHAMPLAAAPVLTLAGANSVVLITNVALMESAFNLPGAFRNLQGAVTNGDLQYLNALVIECAIFIVLANFAVDLVQALLDPRVRA